MMATAPTSTKMKNLNIQRITFYKSHNNSIKITASYFLTEIDKLSKKIRIILWFKEETHLLAVETSQGVQPRSLEGEGCAGAVDVGQDVMIGAIEAGVAQSFDRRRCLHLCFVMPVLRRPLRSPMKGICKSKRESRSFLPLAKERWKARWRLRQRTVNPDFLLQPMDHPRSPKLLLCVAMVMQDADHGAGCEDAHALEVLLFIRGSFRVGDAFDEVHGGLKRWEDVRLWVFFDPLFHDDCLTQIVRDGYAINSTP